MCRPDLGRDKNILALDAGRSQPLANLALVLVHLGRIDVPISLPQRLLDDPATGSAPEVPGSKPDHRNARAICLNVVHATPKPTPSIFIRYSTAVAINEM